MIVIDQVNDVSERFNPQRRHLSVLLAAALAGLVGTMACAQPCDSFTPLGSGLNFLGAFALAELPNGDLIAGGDFTVAGSVPASRIARWDGANWHALGSGVNAVVMALAVLTNGDVVAGGPTFTTAGGVNANRVARWDGTYWHALGSGVDGSGAVRALAVLPNGDLVAGGDFTAIGGVVATNIARWDGENWSAVGSGLNGAVNALAVAPNGDLVVGGGFTGFVARWDGFSWQTLPGIAGAQVRAVAVRPNGEIVAGGFFSVPGNRIARWNGTSWQPLGSGVSAAVDTLSVLANGDVAVGGQFATTGDGALVLNHVARWDGSAWHTFGSGVDNIVASFFTRQNGELVVGGRFLTANGVSATRIAAWQFCVSDTTGACCNGSVCQVLTETQCVAEGGDYLGDDTECSAGQCEPPLQPGIHVPAHFASIQAAINAANHGDQIVVAPGTYYEAIVLNGKAVHLRSSHGPQVTTIDATGLSASGVRCMNGEGPGTIVEGLTITGGSGTLIGGSTRVGGGMFNAASSPTILNCVFVANQAFIGGGMYNVGAGSPIVTNCAFDNNVAAHDGGGMYMHSGNTAIITNCTFRFNTASNGGAVVYNFNSNPTFIGCMFESNHAYFGGAVLAVNGSNAVISKCVFDGNVALSSGGAFHNYINAGALVVTESVFRNNTAGPGGGGAIRSETHENATVAVADSLFCGSTPIHISGVWTDNGGNDFHSVCPPLPALVDTPSGASITVAHDFSDGSVATITYSSISNAGETSITPLLPQSDHVPPAGFTFGNEPFFGSVIFQIQTTASIDGPIEVCFTWPIGTFANEAGLRLFHSSDGVNWDDVTTSVNHVMRTICGSVAGFSYFGVFEAANETPVAICNAFPTYGDGESGSDVTLQCDSPAGRMVTLDATGSFDPDDHAITYRWEVSDLEVLLDDPDASIATGVFPCGVTMVTLTVTDEYGAFSVCDVLIRVQDNTPPKVMVTSDLASLWPPNHKMVTVQVIVTATDACYGDGFSFPVVVTLRSNELDNAQGNSDGNTTGDCHGEDGFTAPIDITSAFVWHAETEAWIATIHLRAERAVSGGGKGRAYSIDAMALDCSGNIGTSSCVIVVPKSMGNAGSN